MSQIHPLRTSLPPWHHVWQCASSSARKSAALGSLPSLMTVAFPLLFPQFLRSRYAALMVCGTKLHRTSRLPRSRTLVGGLSRWASRRRRLILGCTLRLNLLRHKTSVFRETSFHQCLRLVYERIRQRIATYVTHRQRLSFALQYKIHPPRHPVNAPRFDRTAYPQTVSPGISL